MKILFAIKSLKVKGGGAERVLADVANYLSKKGHEISILTFDPLGSDYFYEVSPNIKVYDLNFGRPGKPTSMKKFVKSIPEIRKRVGLIDPELVVGFMHSTYVPIGLALLGTGRRLVTSEHIDYVHFQTSRFQRVLAALIRKKSVLTTVPTQTVKSGYPISEHEKIIAMPNPVNLRQYREVPSLDGDEKIILCVGRFMDQKDHTTLFRAFLNLQSDFPLWRIRCVGDGPLRKELEKEINTLKLRDKIMLPGQSTQMPKEYSKAAFVAIPSLYESFGLVAVEALASSRPVVAFNTTAGINEIIQSEYNGILVEGVGNRVLALEQGMRRLMTDSKLRKKLGEAGPLSVSEYDSEVVAQKWENLLLDLV